MSFWVDLAGFGTRLIPIFELSRGELVDNPPLLLVHPTAQHQKDVCDSALGIPSPVPKSRNPTHHARSQDG